MNVKLNSFINLISVNFFLLLSACGQNNSDTSLHPLIGEWAWDCSPLFSSDEIKTTLDTQVGNCNPEKDSLSDSLKQQAQECFNQFSNYYYQRMARFSDSALQANSPRYQDIYTVYYADNNQAISCSTSYRYARSVIEYSYEADKPAESSEQEISAANGYPDQAHPLDLQTVNFARVFYDDAIIETLNANELCEYTDWQKDTEKNVQNKENCPEFDINDTLAKLALTHRAIELTTDNWDIDGVVDTPYKTGVAIYSIYLIDELNAPKTLQLGKKPEIKDTDTQQKETVVHDGSSVILRLKELGQPYKYVGAIID